MTSDSASGAASPRHHPEQHRFVVLQDGLEAELVYQLESDHGPLIVEHTHVPDAWRGQGIAALLMGACVAHAIEHGMKIVPRCSYAAAFLGKHPEFAEKVS